MGFHNSFSVLCGFVRVQSCYSCSSHVLAGDVLIIGKLKNLVPVLVNCFYGLMPVIHPQLQLDSHSFVCMLSILQSLDQVVQYVYEVRKYQLDLRSSMSFFVSTEIPIQDEKVPSSLLDRLFAAFPMQQARSLSKEVCKFFSVIFQLCYFVLMTYFLMKYV